MPLDIGIWVVTLSHMGICAKIWGSLSHLSIFAHMAREAVTDKITT